MSDNLKAQLEAERRKRKELADAAASTGASDVGSGIAHEIKYDTDLYSTGDKYAGYDTSIDTRAPQEYAEIAPPAGRFGITAPRELIDELNGVEGEDAEDPFKAIQRARGINRVIADRESDYQKRRHDRQLSPERTEGLSYSEAMHKNQLDRERVELTAKIKKARETAEEKKAASDAPTSPRSSERPKRRWDVETPVHPSSTTSTNAAATKRNRWDQTPVDLGSASATSAAETPRRNRWDETPKTAPGGTAFGETPKRTRSRWDETPLMTGGAAADFGATPAGNIGFATPSASQIAAGVSGMLAKQQEHDQLEQPSAMDARSIFQTDEELDALLPSQGYVIMEPPSSYVPIRTPSRKLMATPAPLRGSEGFHMPEESRQLELELPKEVPGVGALPFFKQEDMQFFGKLLDGQSEDDLDVVEKRERQVLRLLLKIKNGAQPMRKAAMRQIAERAREFGATAVFNQILPLLMSASLEEQERHLLVKVIDRVMFRLGDLVRPFVHKILVVIEPMLIDEDRYARSEGCEIISNLAKAAGLPTMIATMRPDIDHVDEYVRNTTARALSVVASALGVPALLPFLKAVCMSKKSWQARQTGIRVVRQTAILIRSGILPHLRNLVDCISHGLEDENQPVRTTTALALAALAEAAAPYGIESFDTVLKPLWTGIRKHRGKGLAAFLKAIGFIIPLMEVEYANHYTREVMVILIREFQSPDEYMKNIVLKVIKQCVGTPGVPPQYIKDEILPEYFRSFWVRRMALERRQYYQVVETTVELAGKVGGAEVISRIVLDLKDESGAYRNMVMETITRIVSSLGGMDIEGRLEELLMDGVLYAFQEQAGEGTVMLDGFGVVVNGLGERAKPYLQQITSALLWRLNNQNPLIRQQAADLVAKIAAVMKLCGEDELMGRISVMLYEYLGEEYPEVLGSILGGLNAIVNVIGMTDMQPAIGDLLPRLTPILKNRHEKVQENCIAEGTLVIMADGTSRPIESVVAGDCVASPRVAGSGSSVVADPAMRCTRVLDNGVRDCVALVFEDGRELVCTPDHRLLRFDGQWQTAGEISMGTRVAVTSSEAPAATLAQVSATDRAWSLEPKGPALSMATPEDCARTTSTPVIGLSVASRRSVGARRVFDLTVPGSDAFFASGVAVHNCIDLIGRIADRGAEYVSAREWMRNCFSLLDLLRAHKKDIRRAAVNTFGYIAKAIGPQDVLATLLNNLKVQERQNRVCTTVAIAIVAETCAPFTVLPALMNEYRVPELNVQNGVLKSISFLFEYIGAMGKDYVNAVTPLLEDALVDRDLVHRQQAASVIKHMALGVAGLNNEDPVLHLLNFLWPNIFETSPHSICAVLEAIESSRVCLGPGRILQYTLQGLFHPARKVREVYWRIYNMMYVGSQAALVAFYPAIDDDGPNTYSRYELDYIL